jgi:hypothetical protein
MPDLHERSTSIVSHSDGDLEEIQRVLLVEERRRLDKLEDRLKNSVVDAPLVANVLPDAIRQCTKQDQHLEKSLAPIIGKTFDLAIKDLSQDIAGVFYPVMGPAIRKAVAAALQDAVQFMNRTLDHSLSWRGMTWRWEAWRTGKSFADVVMSHTLQYRVERVFLFFREDGVHLGEVNHPSIRPFEHKDLASSMFSAIQTTMQKFAHDEFQASEHAPLKAIEIDDDLTVLIEQGPKASLAAVVRTIAVIPPCVPRCTGVHPCGVERGPSEFSRRQAAVRVCKTVSRVLSPPGRERFPTQDRLSPWRSVAGACRFADTHSGLVRLVGYYKLPRAAAMG